MDISNLFITYEDTGSPFSTEDFLSKLFPNPWDALAVFLAFVILLVVVFYVAYKPVKKLIHDRKQYVESNLRDSEASKAQSQKLLRDAEEDVLESKKEALKIVEDAKTTANIEKEKILESAKIERKQIIDEAKVEIDREIENSKDEIHEEIVSVAMDASKKLLSREVNSKDNAKLVDDFISNLESSEK